MVACPVGGPRAIGSAGPALLIILVALSGPAVEAQLSPPPARPPPACAGNETYNANTINLIAAKTNSSLPPGWTQALTVGPAPSTSRL